MFSKLKSALFGAKASDALIDPNEYDAVICIKGRHGRLYENGQDTTAYVKKIELSHEAGSLADLAVTRHVVSNKYE